MIIFIKNIPDYTRKKDIKDFIEPAIKGGLFSKSGRIESISILVQTDTKTYNVEYHGKVTIMPDSVAKRSINKLKKKRINGKYVRMHEYQIRCCHNDQRIIRDHQIERLNCRRLSDRRSRHLEIEEKILLLFS